MTESPRPVATIAVAWLAAAAVVIAAQPPGDRAGAWNVIAPVFSVDMTTADRTAATAWVNRILAVLRRAPSLAPAAGFRVVQHVHLSLDNLDHSADDQQPRFVVANILLNLAAYDRTVPEAAVDERDTVLSIEIAVNDLQPIGGTAMGDQGHDWQDREGTFIQDPAVSTETRHGYPVFEADNLRKWTVIRRSDVPFFAPVTRERYLQLFIRYAEDELTTLKTRRARILANVPAAAAALDEHVGALERRVAAAKETLASMSSAQRRQPVRLADAGADDRPPAFATPESNEGTSIVFRNPALMDARLPRSAPQLLAIAFSSRSDRGRELADAIDGEIDWPALADIVRKD